MKFFNMVLCLIDLGIISEVVGEMFECFEKWLVFCMFVLWVFFMVMLFVIF